MYKCEFINKERRKNFNIGIELLRFILSLLIVTFHMHPNNHNNYLVFITYFFIDLYTSEFFLISFYFSSKSFSSKEIIVKKKRFERILIPYIIWPIVIFVENNIYSYIKSKKLMFSLKTLFFQYIAGRKINSVFWFQFNLIFISIIIVIIRYSLTKNGFFLALFILVCFAIFFNLKNYDSKIFSIYDITISQSVGRLSYSIIYSITGLFLGSRDLLGRINKNYKFKILLFYPIFIYILKIYNKVLFQIFPKFRCLIIDIYIVVLFILFGSIPFGSMLNIKSINLIRNITSYTGGVYYIHIFIIKLLSRISQVIRDKNIKSCLIVYIICYLICVIFSKIFKQSKFKYLFI